MPNPEDATNKSSAMVLPGKAARETAREAKKGRGKEIQVRGQRRIKQDDVLQRILLEIASAEH